MPPDSPHRLVGHACLCRDASSRLAALLAALAAMPSLTALTLSDTFSERMGQKYWAASVCAQASRGRARGREGIGGGAMAELRHPVLDGSRGCQGLSVGGKPLA